MHTWLQWCWVVEVGIFPVGNKMVVSYLKDKWMVFSAKFCSQLLVDFSKVSLVKYIVGDSVHFFCKPDSKLIQLQFEGVSIDEYPY